MKKTRPRGPHTLATDTVAVAGPMATPCRIWKWGTNGWGYGHTGHRRKGYQTSVPAHRVFYEQAGKKIPAGYDIDHLCRNRLCCNHEHMEVVTRAKNLRRGKGTKLTDSQVLVLRSYVDWKHARKQRIHQESLEAAFGIGHSALHMAYSGGHWRDISIFDIDRSARWWVSRCT